MITQLLHDLNEQNICLIAVSKTKPVGDILKLYNIGQRDFGENRVQELCDKQTELPEDIRWHMIGHLQKNKVKYIAEFIHLIHSVDSLKLAQKINNEAAKHNRKISILLQIKIAKEDSKSGIHFDTLKDQIEQFKLLDSVSICGVMGIGTLTDDIDITSSEFGFLRTCFEHLKSNYFLGEDQFKEISMGMSGDYLLAIKNGSTMVRIGSLVFGARN